MISWYIDPQNSSNLADDSNDGMSLITPLKTFSEFSNRLGYGGRIQQNTNVFVMSDGYATDPVNLNLMVEGLCSLVFYGGNNTTVGSGATPLQTGIFSNVINLNRSTNTATQGTDSLSRSWLSFVGKRIRDTFTNAYAWIVKDLGSGTARLSSPSIDGSTYLVSNVITTIFNTTNTYQVEDLRKLWIGAINILGTKGTSVLAFQDFEIQAVSDPVTTDEIITYRGCRFMGTVFAVNDTSVNFSNCIFGLAVSVISGIVQIDAGAALGFGSSVGGVIPQSGKIVIDGDFIQQGEGMRLVGGAVILGAVAIFDAPTLIGGNPRGSGIVIGGTGNTTNPPGAQVRLQTVQHGTPAIYGSGNAGYGLDIFPTLRMNIESGAILKITGNSGDFILGSDATNINYATKATATSSPTYSASIIPSWNNFTTSQPSGFGGNAHNVAADTHLVIN